jgi:YidC/Oxa1 family membrane protein insertase
MNKTEKLICLVLGGVLAWYLFVQQPKEAKARAEYAKAQAEAVVARQAPAQEPAEAVAAEAGVQPVEASAAAVAVAEPAIPEEIVVLENDELKLDLSTWGGVVKKATLKKYAQGNGPVGKENPAVEFDFSSSPLGELGGATVAYAVASATGDEVLFVNGDARRKVSLGAGYRVTFEDSPAVGKTTLSLESMAIGASKNDLLSVDSWALDAGKGKEGVVHHCEGGSPLKGYLVGGLSGGCSGSKSAAGLPRSATVDFLGQQTWVALKNRFFVTALASTTAANMGFSATVERDVSAASYRPKSVSAKVRLDAGDAPSVTSVFYVGPKKQALLWDLGMKDVMEFGMWRWLCYPVVWALNLFHGWLPNYGIAIILLTVLVRVLFWPLTHKSTVGMKKMQEIQPLMKEIQEKYKDNPQRLQQETWALYKDKKVNPMSSCLPMLIQIPVFIALFNVLRSAVELRYAPFLWIADLSEPEALFASWFPFGGLNILPILMAATMALQSALTPSAGDKNQQKMMMVFMPIMMLVMFYSFPSALSLYWTLSQVFSIVQMWLIRRRTANAKGEVLIPEVIDPPVTRQMRRHA